MIGMIEQHWMEVTQLVVFVSAMVGLYFKTKWLLDLNAKALEEFRALAQSNWDRIEGDLSGLNKRLSEHVGSTSPHLQCPAHTTSLTDMNGRMDRIQLEISALRNALEGFHKAFTEQLVEMVKTLAAAISRR